MGTTVYSLIELTTGELHIFAGEMTSDTMCSAHQYSLCSAMQFKNKVKDVYPCKSEDELLQLCSEKSIRKSVCGNCIKRFFKT